MNLFRKKLKARSDEELMIFIRQGNTVAFTELYDRYSRRLLFYFQRMLNGDQDKAQDFLQDLFLKIIEKPDHFHEQKKFSSWIYAVAYNQCKNEYRRLKVRRQMNQRGNVSDKIPQVNEDLGERLDSKFFKKELEKELYNLEPEQRMVFILRFQENFALKEIAQVTGLKEGTIKSRLFYITKRLADNLQHLNPMKQEVSDNVQIDSK